MVKPVFTSQNLFYAKILVLVLKIIIIQIICHSVYYTSFSFNTKCIYNPWYFMTCKTNKNIIISKLPLPILCNLYENYIIYILECKCMSILLSSAYELKAQDELMRWLVVRLLAVHLSWTWPRLLSHSLGQYHHI